MKHTRIETSPTHGRGLFADEAMRAGDLIGEYPLLILSADETETIKSTLLYHYVFWVDDEPSGMPRCAVAFGAISMCNHKSDANAEFQVCSDRKTVRLMARQDIPVNSEIFIDYEDFASEII